MYVRVRTQYAFVAPDAASKNNNKYCTLSLAKEKEQEEGEGDDTVLVYMYVRMHARTTVQASFSLKNFFSLLLLL